MSDPASSSGPTPPAGPTAPRSVLITGCSSGIGAATARRLARDGCRVFATCRAERDCERLRADGLESFRLDYADESSVGAAIGEALGRTGGTLDALFNNGAFASPGAVEDLPRGALREIFETNLFGVHDLTRRAIPAMRAQGHGRILNCSSVLGFVTAPWRGAYVASKFALEGLTDTLRVELRGSGIDVVLIEPGPVATRIRANSIPHFERWINWEASAIADRYRATLLKRLYEGGAPDRFQVQPEAVAGIVARALAARTPRARYRVTLPTHAASALKRLLPTRVLDAVLSRS